METKSESCALSKVNWGFPSSGNWISLNFWKFHKWHQLIFWDFMIIWEFLSTTLHKTHDWLLTRKVNCKNVFEFLLNIFPFHFQQDFSLQKTLLYTILICTWSGFQFSPSLFRMNKLHTLHFNQGISFFWIYRGTNH